MNPWLLKALLAQTRETRVGGIFSSRWLCIVVASIWRRGVGTTSLGCGPEFSAHSSPHYYRYEQLEREFVSSGFAPLKPAYLDSWLHTGQPVRVVEAAYVS